MLARIEALPDQCEDAWQHAGQFQLPKGYEGVRELVVLGMGGSATAGAILRSLALETGEKAVYLSRGYEAPAFVGPDTLVVACSHSGNTEETLSAFEQALAAGARGLAVTTGGRLPQLATERGAAVFRYAYDGEPRSALGCQLMTLLALAQRAGVIGEQETAVREAIALMREARASLGFASPATANRAKQLAGRLQGRLPVVIGAGALAEAAHRWKTQINENSESWAIW
ncbi:MAG: SIS domain-containing protein, partial [Chloroflexi bacterium]|nr:SIS domain-containing protein [Chloroflexota bacterium]